MSRTCIALYSNVTVPVHKRLVQRIYRLHHIPSAILKMGSGASIPTSVEDALQVLIILADATANCISSLSIAMDQCKFLRIQILICDYLTIFLTSRLDTVKQKLMRI